MNPVHLSVAEREELAVLSHVIPRRPAQLVEHGCEYLVLSAVEKSLPRVHARRTR